MNIEVFISKKNLLIQESAGGRAKAPKTMRPCPECGVEMRAEAVTKHCKLKHKVFPAAHQRDFLKSSFIIEEPLGSKKIYIAEVGKSRPSIKRPR